MKLLTVEIHRAMSRRVVRVLLGLALLGIVTVSVIVFATSSGKAPHELLDPNEAHPAAMATWWDRGSGDAALSVSAVFLLMGSLFAAASVVGGEWKAGTVTTVLTWEPRRLRLHAARVAACAVCAFVLALALQVVFLAGLSVAVAAHGTTTGVDGGWWAGLALNLVRVALLTSASAVLGASLATLGRNTTFALAAVFAWMVVAESILRGIWPRYGRFLWGENLGTVLSWRQLDGVGFSRPPALALATIILYCGVLAVAAAASFSRRDISAAA
jgi:hypothetical protein